MLDLREAVGKKRLPRLLAVPAAVTRTVAVKANLFWDKTAYALGRTAGEGRRAAQEHAQFKADNLALVAGSQDEGLVAFRSFLESWTADRFDAAPFTAEMLDANIVFALEGETRYLHEREAAQALLAGCAGSQAANRLCLVTGVEGPLARLHPSIRGVEGAQSSGASLVSFNLDAFTSYGKGQGDNAPTSEAAAFRYGQALNRMLDRGGRNRLSRPVGDATVVFWADAADAAVAEGAEFVFGQSLEPPEDAEEAARVRDALTKVAQGRSADLAHGLKLAPGTRFHVLGLAPNAARLSVRYWLSDSFETFARRLDQHRRDLAVEPAPWKRPPSLRYLLMKTVALQEKSENVPPLLAGEVMRAVLAGCAYPRTWLAAVVIRLRAGDDPSRGWHAAAIKACINRMSTEESLPVSLDPDNPSPAYQLGRLFAVLEAAQYVALGRVNASIADRYYGAASATPARVFGALLRGAKTHVSDARKRNKGGWIEPKLGEIIARLPADLPKTLRLEDQGRFAVGYYHERAFRPDEAHDPQPADAATPDEGQA